MTRKRIVILTQYFPPEMGAPQSRLWETAVGLKKRGWEVQVVCAMPNYPTGKIFEAYRSRLSTTEELDGIVVHRYWIYASNAKKSIPRIISMLSFSFTALFAWFKIRRFKPDYIFTESPPLTLALSGLILSATTGSKHIMNVSDLWPLSAYELGAIGKGRLYSLLESLEKFLYRRSFACTGQSVEITEQLKQRGSKRTHLYRNGVDYNRFITIEKKNSSGHSRKIVYAGLLGVAQGIYNICRYVNFQQYQAEFHIYGDGAEREEIEAFIRKNPHLQITYHGKAHRDEIPAILKSYDATIIPLIKPIFGAIPSKIYEAMAAELPIIFSGGGEGAKLIGQYQTGWICTPSDFESMNTILSQLATMDDDTWNRYRNNCRNAASQVFDREIQINQLDHFLQQV